MLFHKTTIRSEIVDEIIETVHKHKSNFVDVSHSTATEKGFQSPNILTIFDNNLIKEMLDNQCLYQDIFHIHYIEYSNGGFQKPHNHFKSEEYSFILYDSSLEHSGKESINKKILVGAIKNKS